MKKNEILHNLVGERATVDVPADHLLWGKLRAKSVRIRAVFLLDGCPYATVTEYSGRTHNIDLRMLKLGVPMYERDRTGLDAEVTRPTNKPEWDPCDPECVGWFTSSTGGGICELQRCDACGRFESDDEAAFYAATEAQRLYTAMIAGENVNEDVRVFLQTMAIGAC